jgi:hypothetical protein
MARIFRGLNTGRVSQLWITLRGYVPDAELFKDHAGAGLL